MNGTVLAICGWKNSGKTTLVESLIPRLTRKGLAVAAVKHDSHGIDVDRPGKDSDRFFRAGADVVLQGPGEEVRRRHASEADRLDDLLDSLMPRYDLVLVEGHKGTPLPKIWLRGGEGEEEKAAAARRAEVANVLLELARDDSRVDAALDFIDRWLPARWMETPLLGCLLIGGKSRRMGRPKHLLRLGEETWVEHIARVMGEAVDEVVVAGEGELPGSLAAVTRLPDLPGIDGPLSGILSAMRWHRRASWIVAACDLPCLTAEAVEWLAAFRKPGLWAVVPAAEEPASAVEPLLAYYDFRVRPQLESMVLEEDLSLYRVAELRQAISPRPPQKIAAAWKNCNTLDDLDGEIGSRSK